MATRYAVTSGLWDDPIWSATSGGVAGSASVPVAGDDANINRGIHVTVGAGISNACRRIVIGNAVGTGTAHLTINGTMTMDAASSYVLVGNGSGNEGWLTLGAGGVLNNPIDCTINNCIIDCTSTKGFPFAWNGNNTINVPAGMRADINLAGVNFNGAGQVVFDSADTTGTATPRVAFANCTFTGSNGVTFGSAALPNTTVVTVDNCDFRSFATIKTITMARAAGGSGNFWFKNCTIHQAISGDNAIKLTPTTTLGLVVSGCWGYNFKITPGAGANAIVSDCCMNAGVNAPFIFENGNPCTITRIYIPSIANNGGGVNSTGTVGTGTNSITDCIMDGVVDGSWTGRPDFLLPNATPLATDYLRNIIIGAGEHCIGFTAPNWQTLNAKNNTTVVTVAQLTDYGGFLYFCENVNGAAGTINLANNLYRGNGNGGGQLSGSSSSPSSPQTYAYSDYNFLFNITSAAYQSDNARLLVTAGNTTKADNAAHDSMNVVNPKFFDEARDFGRWNLFFGSGTDSYADAWTWGLARNGYQGTPNFNQLGTASAADPRQLRDWVAYGMSPTNTALRAAGDPADGSPDIGAMPVRTIAGTFF